jgi:hypothetical protein
VLKSRSVWLLSFVSAIVLLSVNTSSSAQTINVSDQFVQGCPLVLGDVSFHTTVSHRDGALLLKMEPVRQGSCSRFKALRLISPDGKRLKPRKIKPRRAGRGRISIGVGRRSGGSTGGSVFVHGGPSGGYGGSNHITYVFERGLPAGTLGSEWMWVIKTFDRCTKTREELQIPVDQLLSCETD